VYDNLIDYAHRKLMEMDRKIERGEQPEEYELQCALSWAKLKKDLQTSVAMHNADNVSRGMSYSDGRVMSYGSSYATPWIGMSWAGDNGNMPMSYADGRGGPNRDDMGRYSGNDMMSETMRSVRAAMPTMPDNVRQAAQGLLNAMQQQGIMR
jgi:hypothetical protein